MKIIKKFSFITLLVITILSTNLGMVNATTDCSAKFKLSSNTSSANVGDEITITFNISSITGFDGIHLIAVKKVYDSSIFKYIGAFAQNGWVIKADATNIILQRDAGDTNTGTICTLKFKILKQADNSNITLSHIDATGNNGDVYFEDNNVNAPSLNIKITEKIEEPVVIEEKETTTRNSFERDEVAQTETKTNAEITTKTKNNTTIENNIKETFKNNNSATKEVTNTKQETSTITEKNNSNSTIDTKNNNSNLAETTTKNTTNTNIEVAAKNNIDSQKTNLVENTKLENSETDIVSNNISTDMEMQTNNSNIAIKTIINTLILLLHIIF